MHIATLRRSVELAEEDYALGSKRSFLTEIYLMSNQDELPLARFQFESLTSSTVEDSSFVLSRIDFLKQAARDCWHKAASQAASHSGFEAGFPV